MKTNLVTYLIITALFSCSTLNAATLFSAAYNTTTRTTVYNFSGAPVDNAGSTLLGTQNVLLKDFATAALPGWSPQQVFAQFPLEVADVGFFFDGNDLALGMNGNMNVSNSYIKTPNGGYLLSNSNSLTGGTLTITEGFGRNVVAGTYNITVGGTSIGSYEVSVVPEPSRALLAGLGICGLLLRRRRVRAV